MEFFFLLMLSVPFFYILGIIYFISWFRKKTPSKDSIIADLEDEVHKHPKKLLKDYLLELKNESSEGRIVKLDADGEPVFDSSTEDEEPKAADKTQIKESKTSDIDISKLWSNWYSNNSINLLLYLGAFLILAAASIFVGFQWETIPGFIKALLLSSVAVLFFIFGLFFHSIPKIKTAGITFIGIGALLIPVCSTGWYNFVLKDMSVTGGTVWFVTSIISLVLYIYLAYKFKNSFFSYSSSIATMSLALSLVNVVGLKPQAYILASIIGSFLLLVIGIMIKRAKIKETQHISLPFEISSQVVMPITILYGLRSALDANALFTFEGSASFFIAALFYFFNYLSSFKIYALVVSQFLLPIGIFVFFRWLSISDSYLFYTLDFLALLYIYVAFLLKNDNYKEASDSNLGSGILLSIIVFAVSLSQGSSSTQIFILSLVPIIAGIATAIVKNNIRYAYISSAFLIFSVWIFLNKILHLGDNMYLFGHTLAFIGILMFLENVLQKPKNITQRFLNANTALYFSVAFLVSINHYTTEAVIFTCIAAIFLVARHFYDETKLLIGFAVSIYLGSIFFMLSMNTAQQFYPLVFSGISVALYSFSFLTNGEDSDTYKNLGLAGQIMTMSFYLIFAMMRFPFFQYPEKGLSTNALITGYMATCLTAIDAYIRKIRNVDYAASAIGIVTYLWQIAHMGITETLYYTIPVGIYFLVLGYLRSLHKDDSSSGLLSSTGVSLLIFPTFSLSLSNGVGYSLILALIALILLSTGITLKNKIYTIAGAGGIILAILPQAYQYIMSIPKWALVGIVGILFVTLAIYLLLKRSEAD